MGSKAGLARPSLETWTGVAVNIFHTGGPEDRDFAVKLAERIRSFSTPLLVDVDHLERMDSLGTSRSERFRGVPVCILSPAMLRSHEYRQKLVAATPGRNLPGRSAFYIARGLTTDDIRAGYPDLQKLFLDVMVGEEEDLPALVDELRAYVEVAPDDVTIPQRLRRFAQLIAANTMLLVGIVGRCAYFAGFLTAPWLLWSLLMTEGQPRLETWAAFHLLYAMGYGATHVRPLDLWPWLGPAWGIGERPLGNHPDSACTRHSFVYAIGPWQRTAEVARTLKFTALCWLTLPGAAGLARSQLAWAGGAAFLLGLAMPGCLSAALRFFKRRAYWNLGLTDHEMERTARSSSPWGFPITTEAEYRHRLTRGGRFGRRPWLRTPPRVFISYAWRDEDRAPVAGLLERSISQMGVPCFLDARQIQGKFASWRTRVVDELLVCTHVFVILGPHVREADVVHREIRTLLQRWYTELEPAVICVVESDVLTTLSASVLSPELKFLLHEAPKITYAEAGRPDILARLVLQRRRQGLCQDWLALLSPAQRLHRFLAAASLPMEDKAV